MDVRSRRTVLLGAGALTALTFACLLTLGRDSLVLWSLGVPAGVLVGLLSHEYAPVVRDGLAAGALGSVVVFLVISAEAFRRSLAMGFGVDSWVSFGGVAAGLWALIVVGPAFIVECCVVAVLVHEARVRRGTWAGGKEKA